MYTFWKRTVPPPSMITFDAPDRETCTVREARTNTPLQALVLLNDVTYVEAARKLAERMLTEGGRSPEDRIAYAYRFVLARAPPAKKTILLATLDELPQTLSGRSRRGRKTALGRRIGPRPESGSPRTGGVHQRRQRALEPGRNDHQAVAMDPKTLLTRRHFFRVRIRSRHGRSGRLLTNELVPLSTGALPGLPHFAPKAKRVIYLFQSGGPSQMDLFDYKPRAQRVARHRAARLRSHGPAAHRHDSAQQASFPVVPSIFKFAQYGQIRRVDQRAAAAHGQDRRRPVAFIKFDAHRSHQSRSRRHLLPDRIAARRAAQHRLLGGLRPGQREPGPARRSS